MTKNKLIGFITAAALISSFAVGCVNLNAHLGKTNNSENKILLAQMQSNTSNEGVVINTNKAPLVLYSNANANSNIESYVSVGEMLSVEGSSNGFYKVRVQETGATGYISGYNIQMITSGVNDAYYNVNRSGSIINVDSDVHLRTNATMTSNVLGSFKNGTSINVLGKKGSWYNVEVGNQKGYIYQEYVAIDNTNTDIQTQNVKSQTSNTAVNTNANTSTNTQTQNGATKQNNIIKTPNKMVISSGEADLSNYYGRWTPTKNIGYNGSLQSPSAMTQQEIAQNKLILTKNLYSYNGVTIQNPKYYQITYNTANAFGNMELGGYEIKGLGNTITEIIAVPQNQTVNLSKYTPLEIDGLPTITNGKIIAFNKYGTVYQYSK